MMEKREANAAARLLGGLLDEALSYERAAWGTDEEINGGDLVDWFGEWRERVKAELVALGVYGPPELPRPRLTHPGCTVEDLQNDADALTVAREIVAWAAEVAADYAAGGLPADVAEAGRDLERILSNGAGARDLSAVEAWLRERKAETENTIGQLDGIDPETVNARVVVAVEGGVVHSVIADTPGVAVLVKDFDTEGGDPESMTCDRNGDRAYFGLQQVEHAPAAVVADYDTAARLWPNLV